MNKGEKKKVREKARNERMAEEERELEMRGES